MSKKMARNGRLRKPGGRRLRKPHRREWPGFLRRLIPDQTWRGLARLAKDGRDPRTRWSRKLILLGWMMMAWSIQDQLTERFREGRETLTQMFCRRRRCGASYQGLTKATRRFGVGLFHWFWACLRPSIPERVGSAWTWHGWVVLSLAKALRVIHAAIEALRHGESCAWLLSRPQEAVLDEYKRLSSKRARDWPYQKNERPPGPPKLRRLRMSEKTRIHGLLMPHAIELS